MQLSLRTKILLLVAGTVTVLSGAVLIALSVLAETSTRRAAQADVRATRAVLSELIGERSKALTDQCLLAARQPWLRAVIGTEDPATVTDCLHENLKQLHADVLIVTDRDGRLLGETDSVPTANRILLRDKGTSEAMAGNVWSGVVNRHGMLALAVSVPVYNGAYVCGTMTGYSAIDSRVAADLKSSLGADVAFVDSGRVMASSTSVPRAIDAPETAPSVITVGGERYFALYSPLPDAPHAGIGFITMRSYNSLMAPYDRGRYTFGAILAATLLLALLAGLGIARSITRPLSSVVHAAQILREGAWPERFEENRSDEIGLLQTVFNDMTASMKANQEKLLALIDTDLLTGLDNHRRFQERLEQEAKRQAASDERLSLLLVDIDHFHQFNQEHGHAIGDEALTHLAKTLQASIPDVATVARFGGEEFAVLLPQHDLKQTEALAHYLQKTVFTSNETSERARGLTVSIGCAEFGAHCKSSEELVLAAELAVSQAKQLGRNQVCRFDGVPRDGDDGAPYELHRFLKDSSLATIQALAAAVDTKDPYTRGHSQSVAKYASALAKHLGLPPEMVDLIHTSGTLHDVGKIGVPDGILNKPGKLDEAERRIMETHPVLGELIVRKAPQLAATLPAVRHHHERWDGAGYPDRLSGENIPYIARLLALADCYDAMTSDRPYRKGLPDHVALEEIRKNSGTQFDPEMAQAFLAMMDHDAHKRAA